MLVVPITGKISWKNPPIITIVFIIINCLIFFLFQRNDNFNYYKAHEHYFKSGLAEIELSAYLAYKSPGTISITEKINKYDNETLSQHYKEMESDVVFQKSLRTEQVITRNDPEYEKWKKLKTENQALLSDVVFLNYGFRPAYINVLTPFTYMFLHGGFGHLLGNMVFLWLVGCMLEMGCGRIFCVATYIVTGLFSVLLFWLIYMNSTIPLVGASGSIAGFMGAFTTVYGRTKIKVFYSLGFYFNYLKFPAIMLFPIWIGNELFQLFLGGQSNVAYVAHIGGLLSGATIGYLDLKFFKLHNKDIFKEEPKDEISPLMEQALQCIGKLELEDARKHLEEILVKDPYHKDALTHLFNVEKLDPKNQTFHHSAKRLLYCFCRNREDHGKLYEIYKEYTALTDRPKLSSDLYARLSSAFSGIGQTGLSEKLLSQLLKKIPEQPGIPEGLLKLANAHKKKGNQKKWEKCLKIVCSKYPESTEAIIAQNLLLKK